MKKLFYILLVLVCVSCKRKVDVAPLIVTENFSNVLILGNSITSAPQDLSIGWNGNWGMAASAAEQDYVHLLTGKFVSVIKTSTVKAVNISLFEYDAANYDFDAALKSYRDNKPDLLIIRIGENVPQSFDPDGFTKRYQALISYMKVNNPNLKVLSVGSFFLGHDKINEVMAQFPPFISLYQPGSDISNLSFNLKNASYAVQLHPNDKGMLAIADTIWAKVQRL